MRKIWLNLLRKILTHKNKYQLDVGAVVRTTRESILIPRGTFCEIVEINGCCYKLRPLIKPNPYGEWDFDEEDFELVKKGVAR